MMPDKTMMKNSEMMKSKKSGIVRAANRFIETAEEKKKRANKGGV